MKVFKSAAMAVACLALSCGAYAQNEGYDGDYYANCLLDRVKPGMDASAVAAVRNACFRLSIPKKCRDKEHKGGDLFSDRALCFSECKEASFYERRFGTCSVG